MAEIKIENGCVWEAYDTAGNSYYRMPIATVQSQTYVRFMAKPGEKPEFGDSIVDGVLVKRQGYQINQDKRMWRDKWWNDEGHTY